jgi:hypothetical protein
MPFLLGHFSPAVQWGQGSILSSCAFSQAFYPLLRKNRTKKFNPVCGDYFLKFFLKKYIKIFFIFLNLFLYYHIKII